MNFTEQEGQYVKELNKIDAYLLRIIKRYFDIENINNTESREGIIAEAIMRFKESLNYKMAPVQSLNMKKGAVTIGLKNIEGEPLFAKKTAFNKSFGTSEDSVCEGNDDRLSDDRESMPHKHTFYDVEDIMHRLNEYKNYLVSLTKILHTHSNLLILDKITYSGAQEIIDLYLLEQTADMLSKHMDQIKETAIAKKDLIDSMITDIEKQLDSFDSYFELSKNKLDLAIGLLSTNMDKSMEEKQQLIIQIIKKSQEGKVLRTHLDELSKELKTYPIYLGNGSINLENATEALSLPLSDDLLDSMSTCSTTFFKAWFSPTKDSGDITKYPIPYYEIQDQQINGSLMVGMTNTTIEITMGNVASTTKTITTKSEVTSQVPSDITPDFYDDREDGYKYAYKIYNDPKTWQEAKDFAISKNGDLAEIHTEKAKEQIQNIIYTMDLVGDGTDDLRIPEAIWVNGINEHPSYIPCNPDYLCGSQSEYEYYSDKPQADYLDVYQRYDVNVSTNTDPILTEMILQGSNIPLKEVNDIISINAYMYYRPEDTSFVSGPRYLNLIKSVIVYPTKGAIVSYNDAGGNMKAAYIVQWIAGKTDTEKPVTPIVLNGTVYYEVYGIE